MHYADAHLHRAHALHCVGVHAHGAGVHVHGAGVHVHGAGLHVHRGFSVM